MSAEDKNVVAQQEYAAPTKRGRIRRHCARWWWVHLIIFACITVLVVCLVIFVGVPNIAQQRVNKSSLTVDGISMTNSQPESFTLSINATIHADNSIHAVLDPFTGVMYLEDLEPHTPFLTIDFPQTTSDSTSTVNVTQDINITDMAAFTTFNTWLLLNDTLRVTISGSTKIKVNGISRKYNVNYNKTISLPGIRNFNGSNVNYATISLTAGAGENDFNGYASIPDTSIVNLDIGNVTWDTYLLGQYVGVSHLNNVFLRPGTDQAINNFTMHANITQTSVLSALGQQPYCQTGILPFEFHGTNIQNNGQNLSYFLDSLTAANQTMNIDLGTIMKNDLNITVPCSSSS